MSSEGAYHADGDVGTGVGRRSSGRFSQLVWLAVLGAACAVVGPILLSSYAVQVVGEGSVGVLRFGGKIVDNLKNPGFHFVPPFFFELIEVPVNVRTTEIRQVECGTSGGVLIHFPLVEIIHRLHPANVVRTLRAYEDYEKTWIIQRVEQDVNRLCARHSLHEIYIDKFDQLDDMLVASLKETASVWVPGLMIIAARVAKPTIPQQLQRDFVRVEEEISKLKIAHQHEQLVVRDAEMERSKQVMAAEKNRDIGVMTMAREVEKKGAELRIQRIQDEMHVARSKDHADATSYARIREAEGNERRLSAAFLELARQTSLYRNLELAAPTKDRIGYQPTLEGCPTRCPFYDTKAYYGNRMPEYIHDRPPRTRTCGFEGKGEGGGLGSDGINMARAAAAFWRSEADTGNMAISQHHNNES